MKGSIGVPTRLIKRKKKKDKDTSLIAQLRYWTNRLKYKRKRLSCLEKKKIEKRIEKLDNLVFPKFYCKICRRPVYKSYYKYCYKCLTHLKRRARTPEEEQVVHTNGLDN